MTFDATRAGRADEGGFASQSAGRCCEPRTCTQRCCNTTRPWSAQEPKERLPTQSKDASSAPLGKCARTPCGGAVGCFSGAPYAALFVRVCTSRWQTPASVAVVAGG